MMEKGQEVANLYAKKKNGQKERKKELCITLKLLTLNITESQLFFFLFFSKQINCWKPS